MGFRTLRKGLIVALSAGVSAAAPPGAETMETAPILGRVVVLPGIYNTRFHLRGLVEAAEAALPAGFAVEVRPWGVPFLGLYNLLAADRNRAAARRLATELADWRRAHPDAALYVVGYSGGGGIATLMLSALPDDVSVDRLILVAPAIAPDYPLETAVLPKIGEFVVNFASDHDLQVGWGTRIFGTIDRKKIESAGAIGFSVRDPRVLEWHWTQSARPTGHGGNHLGYLGRRWQAALLLPALDPGTDAAVLRRRFAGHGDPNEPENDDSR